MKTNFSKIVYRLHIEGDEAWVEESKLSDVVYDSAETTTSPRGVEPKLHIENKDGKFELRQWGEYGRGNTLIETFNKESEAEQRWLELTYNHDFLSQDLQYIWFDSIDAAIDAYVEGCEEEVTAEEIKATIDRCNKDHSEYIEYVKSKDKRVFRDGVDIYKRTGCITKGLRMVCELILFDNVRSNPWERKVEIIHDPEFISEVRDFYKNNICKI